MYVCCWEWERRNSFAETKEEDEFEEGVERERDEVEVVGDCVCGLCEEVVVEDEVNDELEVEGEEEFLGVSW